MDQLEEEHRQLTKVMIEQQTEKERLEADVNSHVSQIGEVPLLELFTWVGRKTDNQMGRAGNKTVHGRNGDFTVYQLNVDAE